MSSIRQAKFLWPLGGKFLSKFLWTLGEYRLKHLKTELRSPSVAMEYSKLLENCLYANLKNID